MRIKWGAGELQRCALTTTVETMVYPKSWIWNHFKQFPIAECYLGQQNYEASCNICREEAIVNKDIRWVVFYDKSATKLERHMNRCHQSILLERNRAVAVTVVAEGQTKTLQQFLNTGAKDEVLYKYIKLLVMQYLPVSLCLAFEFTGKIISS